MRKWTIKTQIVFLSVFLLSLIGLVAIVEHVGVGKVIAKYDEVAHVHLPAVRNMTLVDMMHDGLRAVVYNALYLSSYEASKEEKVQVAEELKEFSENIKAYMSAIESLDIDEETKSAIADSKGDLDIYIKKSEEIIALSLSNNSSRAKEKITDFNSAFSGLEDKLGRLGELIEKNSEISVKEAAVINSTFSKVSIGIILFGFLLGIFISFMIVKNLMETLTQVIEKLKNSVSEVSSASTQSAASATELSEGSREQAASLQVTMASIEEISAMVAQNAESADKVFKTVSENKKITDDGSRSVTEMIGSIADIKSTNDQILHQMETSNKEFAHIVQIISDIGEKTKVINDIVFQTKLLSFNASVEAARAGEHGKGFAVVAEEVGNLAEMSGNAAKQITDMLANSIKRVKEIVETTRTKVDQLVELGKDKIAMGQSIAQKCKDALSKIAESAQSVTMMVSEITHASKEQSQGVQEINKATSQLDQVTQQNSAVAQQSSSQAKQLSVQAQELNQVVSELVVFVSGQSANASSGPSQGGHRDHSAKVQNISEKSKVKKKTTPQEQKSATEVIKKAAADRKFKAYF